MPERQPATPLIGHQRLLRACPVGGLDTAPWRCSRSTTPSRWPPRAGCRCCCRRCPGSRPRSAGWTAWCSPAAGTSTRPATARRRSRRPDRAQRRARRRRSWRCCRGLVGRAAGARHLPRPAAAQRGPGRHLAPAPGRLAAGREAAIPRSRGLRGATGAGRGGQQARPGILGRMESTCRPPPSGDRPAGPRA